MAGALFRYDGEYLHVASVQGPGRDRILRAWEGFFPYRPGSDVLIGQSVLERRMMHVEDVLALPSNPFRDTTQRAAGNRAHLSVPMLRDGEVFGVIACWREQPRAFGDRQISLLETFAAQAVIAIENARLFTELQSRTDDLTRSVDQLTALGEVGRA